MKIIIADDHALIREGLKKRIEREMDMEVIFEAENGQRVLDFLDGNFAELVVLDMNMPGKSGIDLIQEISDSHPDVKILILSMYPEDQFASRALKAGAGGYVTKDSPPDEIIKAIRRVYDGRTYVSPEFAEKLAFKLRSDSELSPHEKLSDREFQVLRLIGQGKTLTRVADELFLSQSSVNTYRKRILEKLNLTSTAELIHYAVKAKLVD